MLMKTPFYKSSRTLGIVALAAISLLAITPDASAKDKDDRRGPSKKPSSSSRSWFGDRGRGHDHRDHRDDDDRRRFFAHPRTSWSVTLGNGYAGRGYYYGPPNAPYYYQGTGVSYYSSRERVPYDYWRGARLAEMNAAVQSELRRRGYYRGPVDGRLGPASKSAISRYQSSRGLAVTGNVNNQTLSALGIR